MGVLDDEHREGDNDVAIEFSAAVFTEPNQPLRIEKVTIPESPAPGEVIVELVASGVCHSDLHVLNGEWASPSPMILGHEGAGRVVAVGAGVSTLAEGDHVVLSWTPSCGSCSYCVSGRPVLCPVAHGTAYESVSRDGTTRARLGGQEVYSYLGLGSFGRYAHVAESAAVKIRDDAPFAQAALVGCAVTTGIGAVTNTARVRPGESVAVVGCGGVGINVIQGARLAGASPIIAIDTSSSKLDLARRFGATHVINAREDDVPAAVLDLTHGLGVDYAFEAIGLKSTIETAFHTTGRGGTTVIVGQVSDGVTVELDPFLISNQEKRVIGSNYGSSIPTVDFPRIIDHYLNGRINLDDLVTSEIALDQVNDAFDSMKRGEGLRAVITH